MIYDQLQGLRAFRRVRGWFGEHPEVMSASGSSAPALSRQVDALNEVITTMEEQAAEQASQHDQSKLCARDELTLRTELRTRHIMAIVEVARALHGQAPGIGLIRLPASRLRSERLVKAAEAVAATAAVYEEVLIEHGLPRDFLAQLVAATSALRASVDARGLALSNRAGATARIAEAFDLGRRIIAMIDASLLHALKADSPTLDSWRQVCRITKKPGVPRGSGVEPSQQSDVSPSTPGSIAA